MTEIEMILRSLVGERPGPNDSGDLSGWRQRIDLLDRLILTLLNERAGCANEIGHIKKAKGLPVYVPSREEEVLRNVQDSNQGPLPDQAVRHLFERIIDETRSLERRYYQDEPGDPEGRSPSK